MHPLHDYIQKLLGERLRAKRVVVWYDAPGDFAPFVEELRGGREGTSGLLEVSIDGVQAWLSHSTGSQFEVRFRVEERFNSDSPDYLLIYLAGCERDIKGSVLKELEEAGTHWERKLADVAKNVLLQKFTQGVVDELLPFERAVTYQDLARAAADAGDAPPSILKSIYFDLGTKDLLAAWLVSPARDAEILAKAATPELTKLIRSRIGLELGAEAPLSKLRAVSLRYVLASEFRSDLGCSPPPSLQGIPVPAKEMLPAVREVAATLRSSFADAYPGLADGVEAELGLGSAKLPSGSLGVIDTFRFEERALLQHCGELLAESKFEAALSLVREREQSFWLNRDLGRKAQWEAARRMAELGRCATSVRSELEKPPSDVAAWVEAYTRTDGWYRLDQAQRRLEAWIVNLDEDPEERPLNIVRRAYEDACQAMAVGFSQALERAGFAASGSLHQTRIFSEVVSNRPKPVAYFLVDAMRFEMGVELAERLPTTVEVSVRHAVSALPSITPIGMAALQPGASSSFRVIERSGKLGVEIDETFLPDLAARKKHAAARIPKLVDLSLDELLSLQPSKLNKRLKEAQIILVRSQEIDHAGEAGFTYQARQVMDTVIDNLARAVRKLAAAGVQESVITADHGHLFFAGDRDESMRIENPGGDEVEIHRRCWIGRGGATPSGSFRVAASSLGYASDLDFLFPSNAGVFKARGDLAYHHGGTSLQEMILPVLSIRTKSPQRAESVSSAVTIADLPDAITNRIFTVRLALGEAQLTLGATSTSVRPMLVSQGKQVGAVGMVVGAQFDSATGCVTLEPKIAATVGFIVTDESAKSLRVVVLDPATDAELYRSPADLPVQFGV
jgi:hypothetical protein